MELQYNAVHPERAESPPEVEPQAYKKIKVYVRLSGLIEETIEVPADLDVNDMTAVGNALETLAPYPEGNFWRLGLGEFYYGTQKAPWYDKDRAQVSIEDVEEV